MNDILCATQELIALLREHPELLHDRRHRDTLEELAAVIRDALADANTAALRTALAELGEIFTEDETA